MFWRHASLMIALAFCLLCEGFTHSARAQGGATIQLQPFLSGLSMPVLIRHAGDGSKRLFIVEQTGQIKVLQPGSTTPTVFLDITGKRVCCGEQGLLGLAFHPQFASNRRFFINYTRSGDGATVVSEFLASSSNPNIAETAERILLVIEQPFANHNGGMIEFGPDGFLYIGMGDGGSGNDPGNRAQNINNLLGKMLRIDVDRAEGGLAYASPATNPFFGAMPGRDEIYAVGLRNPWRFSFDRVTGSLYAGDVGQGQREEIDIITRGGNYGWRVFEGTLCTGIDANLCTASSYVGPITEYSHANGRCSVTGGYVYRGARSTLPFGSYVYGDFCTGEIFLYRNGSSTPLIDTSLNISSFGEDEEGELYVVNLGGTILRMVGQAPPPVVHVSAADFGGGQMAAGSIAAAFGTGLATETRAATLPLPTTLGGTQVMIRDAAGSNHLAPLFYVSPGQVNYLIPDNIASGQAEIRVMSGSGAVAVGSAEIVAVAPGIFAANSSGRGVAAALILRQRSGGVQTFEPVAVFDPGQMRFVARPIDLGAQNEEVFLVLFGTGLRSRSSLQAVTAMIGGSPMQVTFAGPQGEFIGLDQVNVQLDASLAGRGEVNVVIGVDGQITNPTSVNFN